MKIDNGLSDTAFENLQPGDVFRYCETVYMKTSEGEKNAVRLDTGRILDFGLNNTAVELFPEAKVTLR